MHRHCGADISHILVAHDTEQRLWCCNQSFTLRNMRIVTGTALTFINRSMANPVGALVEVMALETQGRLRHQEHGLAVVAVRMVAIQAGTILCGRMEAAIFRQARQVLVTTDAESGWVLPQQGGTF
jgi:hypothetical protein